MVTIPDLGPIYVEAVTARGGHEFVGGAVEWERTGPYRCPGCALCRTPVQTQIPAGRRSR